MQFELTEEQISVKEAARDFTQSELLPGVIERDREMKHPTEQVRKMGEMGFLGMMVSPEYGGGGMDTISYVLAMEETSKVDSSCSVIMSVNNSLVCWGIEEYGNEEQKSKYLPRLASRTPNRQEQAEVQQHAPHEQGVRRLDDLLWRAGLLTAGGRRPVDSDPNRPVYLRHWPNLTRISAIPQAVRIAALWSARGASLVETSALLGIPQRNVIAFYNGALALDLITEDGSHIRRAQRKAGRNRGLLTRLLGWLHR